MVKINCGTRTSVLRPLQFTVVIAALLAAGCSSAPAWIVVDPASVAHQEPNGPLNPRHPTYGTVELDFYSDIRHAKRHAYFLMRQTCPAGRYEIVRDPYTGTAPWRPINPLRLTSTIQGPNLYMDFNCVAQNSMGNFGYGSRYDLPYYLQ